VGKVLFFKIYFSALPSVFQEGGPGPLPGPPVQGEWPDGALRGGGEHPDHAPVLPDCARRHEGHHHEGKHVNTNQWIWVSLH